MKRTHAGRQTHSALALISFLSLAILTSCTSPTSPNTSTNNTAQNPSIPGQPFLVSRTMTNLVIAWAPVSNAASYRLFIRASTNSDFTQTNALTGTNYNHTNLAYGVNYIFGLSSVASNFESGLAITNYTTVNIGLVIAGMAWYSGVGARTCLWSNAATNVLGSTIYSSSESVDARKSVFAASGELVQCGSRSSLSNGNPLIACYWLGGNRVDLSPDTNGAGNARANGLTTVGTTVYCAGSLGSTSPSSAYFVFWSNATAYGNGERGVAYDIMHDGADAWSVGQTTNSPYGCYWKNTNSRVQVTGVDCFYGALRNGGDLYAVGEYSNGSVANACFTRNWVKVTLENSTTVASVARVAVYAGGNLYIGGTCNNTACYWKYDGSTATRYDSTYNSGATIRSISAYDGHVYLATGGTLIRYFGGTLDLPDNTDSIGGIWVYGR